MNTGSIPDDWEVVQPFPSEAGAGRRRVRAWSLVLEARGIEYLPQPWDGRTALWVPAPLRALAEEEIRRYEEENRFWPPRRGPEVPIVDNTWRTFGVLTALGLFHDLTVQPPGRVFGIAVAWKAAGAMDAGRVLQGEWWRAVTALTLHADGLHLLGNLAFGGVLFVLLNRQLGVGLGSALVLGAGTLGNLTNALARDSAHQSVGASTAVFGALGALVARAAWGAAHRDWRRWVIPLGAGAGLIALTGVGDETTDYLAHLFGFGWGLIAGALTQWPRPLRRVPDWKTSWLVGTAALGIVVGAWALALPSPAFPP